MATSSPHDAAALDEGQILVGARSLGLSFSEAQAERLVRFARLLLRWNAVHNLTALRNPDEVLTHHLLDSLAILPRLASIFGQRAISVLDVGAGGGLPGIPLAVAKPDWRITVLDKVAKKVAFLRQAKLELGLHNVECVHSRAEDFAGRPYDLVLSRAFASLEDFVRVSRHLIAPEGRWAAMKGAYPKAEVEALARAFPSVRVEDVVKLDIPRLAAERHLILLLPS